MNTSTLETPTETNQPTTLQAFVTTAATVKSNPPEIRSFLKGYCKTGYVYELRTTGDRIWNGYFDNPELMASAAAQLSGTQGVCGVFTTLNPVTPELLARSCNKVKRAGKGEATSAKDVIRRQTFLIDIDSATRPKGISATDAELESAKNKTMQVRDFLRSLGWAEPTVNFSGNGFHLWYAINLPNEFYDKEAKPSNKLLEACLKSLAARFNDGVNKIDVTVFDPSRICKIPGTMNCKGDNFAGTGVHPARPHRLCSIISAGSGTVTRSQLELLADKPAQKAPPAPTPAPTPVPKSKTGVIIPRDPPKHDWTPEDVELMMQEYGIEFDPSEEYGAGLRWRLAVCPFDPVHVNPDACMYLMQGEDGFHYVTFKCSHDSCVIWKGRNAFKTAMQEKFPDIDHAACWHEHRPQPSEKSEPEKKVKLLHMSYTEMKAASLIHPEELMFLLARGTVNIFVGDSGLGKSPLIYQMALCLAFGISFIELPVARRAKVLFVDYENGENVLGLIEALAEFLHIDINAPDFSDWFQMMSSPPAHGDVENSIEAFRPDVVFIDALRGYDPKADKANECAAEMISQQNCLSRKYGCAWGMIHHIRKPDQAVEIEKRPSLIRDENVMEWLNEAAGSRALINQTYCRTGIDLVPKNFKDKALHGDLVLRGTRKLLGEFGPWFIERVFNEQGDPIGYQRVVGEKLLSHDIQTKLHKLPFPPLHFEEIHKIIGSGLKQRKVTNAFLKECIDAGVIKSTGKKKSQNRTYTRMPVIAEVVTDLEDSDE